MYKVGSVSSPSADLEVLPPTQSQGPGKSPGV